MVYTLFDLIMTALFDLTMNPPSLPLARLGFVLWLLCWLISPLFRPVYLLEWSTYSMLHISLLVSLSLPMIPLAALLMYQLLPLPTQYCHSLLPKYPLKHRTNLFSEYHRPHMKRVSVVKRASGNLEPTAMSSPKTNSLGLSMPTYKDSEDFPAFQGGFALQSSDSVRFYVAPYLLQHVSGFFRDMFALPSAVAVGAAVQAAVCTEEVLSVGLESDTLSDLLRLIDPNKLNPVMKAETVSQLMEAARFYQIPCIVTWFRDTVLRGSIDALGEDAQESFVQRHPLLVLSLSHKLGLEKCLQVALRELSMCSMDKTMEDVDVSFRVYRHVLALRKRQTERYHRLVWKLSMHDKSNRGNIKDLDQPTCTYCTVLRGQWFERLTWALVQNPDWASFSRILRDPPRCTGRQGQIACPSHVWGRRMRSLIDSTSSALMTVDLPLTPAWLAEELKANALMNPEHSP